VTIKKAALSLLLLGLSIFSFYKAYDSYLRVRPHLETKPNVLVVSLCSFRMNLLSLYGAVNKEAAPNIEKFFAQSHYVFTNAFNGLGWTNLTNYTMVHIPADIFFEREYLIAGRMEGWHQWRVPLRKSFHPDFREDRFVYDNDFEKDIQSDVAGLERQIRLKRNKPFFVIAHFKYLHYPLIDRFNGSSGWDRYLSATEKEQIIEYLNHPGRYPQKLPFLLFLANNPEHVLEHPRFSQAGDRKDPASIRRLAGLMTNPTLLAEWKSSEGYESDLLILEKIYKANVNYLDQTIAPLLDLYGDKKLQKNTIVIFMGDHGETHMERDELTHGMSLWDTSLRLPLAIRFPGGGRPQIIKEQMDSVTVAKSIRELLLGRNSPREFRKVLNELLPEVTIARDCMNTLRGLRFKNKYKYFVRIADGERFLFDLENDPQESTNLALERPEEAARMEVLYWQNLNTLANIDPNNCRRSVPD